MRQARIFVHEHEAGILCELDDKTYEFSYLDDYNGPPVSLTMPVLEKKYVFSEFPTFFEGLLPEGILLEALLRHAKLDKKDYFGQLLYVGDDVVGAVRIEALLT
jgi:serine/threonine-protein kinase HipA